MKKTIVLGDIHSNYQALKHIVDKYQPDMYNYIFLGDYSDYREDDDKSDYVSTMLIIMNYVKNYNAVALLGNHDDKLLRWFKGNKVDEKEGFINTLKDLNCDANNHLKEQIYKFLLTLPLTYQKIVNGIEYQFAHAYFPQEQEIFARSLDSTAKEWKAYREHCIWGVPRRFNLTTNKHERVFHWNEERYINLVPKNTIKVCGHYHMCHRDDKFIILDGTPHIAIYIIEDNYFECFI